MLYGINKFKNAGRHLDAPPVVGLAPRSRRRLVDNYLRTGNGFGFSDFLTRKKRQQAAAAAAAAADMAAASPTVAGGVAAAATAPDAAMQLRSLAQPAPVVAVPAGEATATVTNGAGIPVPKRNPQR